MAAILDSRKRLDQDDSRAKAVAGRVVRAKDQGEGEIKVNWK